MCIIGNQKTQEAKNKVIHNHSVLELFYFFLIKKGEKNISEANMAKCWYF